jgi:ATP-binding cassette subfamily D (ALD) long-chain fatty acid import protein
MNLLSKPIDNRTNKIFSSSLFVLVLVGLYQSKKSWQKTAKLKQNEKQKDISSLFPIIDFTQKVGVNKEFRRQLASIAHILFPNWHTKEVLLLVLHTIFLVLRTYLSVVVARLDGRIVRDLVCMND